MLPFIFVVSLFLVAAHCQDADPTTVCLPDVYQSNFYDFSTEIGGVMAYDFPNHLLAFQLTNGIRRVFNLTAFSAVSVNDTDGECTTLAPDVRYRTFNVQCVPANAELLSNSSYIGLSPGDTKVQAWKVDIPGVLTVRVALTTTTPAVLVVREYRVPGDTQSQVILFVNPQTSITNKNIFNVPPVCSPATVVG
jgi:hypothetical protein